MGETSSVPERKDLLGVLLMADEETFATS